MDKKTINKIVWWIPVKNIRDSIRDFYNKCFDLENKVNYIKKIMEENNNIKFQSQYDQDFLAYIYFNGRKNGFFIDIGAHDGISINNTYIFEKLGWKGICIEADPDTFKSLQKNRTSDLYNLAIDTESSSSVKFIKSSVDVLNTLEKNCSEEHKRRIQREAKIDELSFIYIKSITFYDLMKNYPNVKHINFFSLDIEGNELSILKTIDFNEYTFDLLTIENNESGNELIDFMKEKGYRVLIDAGCDYIFIPNKI